MALLSILLGCAGMPPGTFQDHLIARIPEGLTPRWYRFSLDGSTVAYIGCDGGARDRVVVGEREGRVYTMI